MNCNSTTWGGEVLHLRFPGCKVTIGGLSRRQRVAIPATYNPFVVTGGAEVRQADVVCHALKLEEPVRLPPESFVADGQYTVRKHRVGDGVRITGYDFTAQFERRASVEPIRASLSVVQEGELAQVSVLGNFLRILLAHAVLDRGGVMLHSAGVVHGERAYLFCGRSNAGKTTLTRKAAAAGLPVLSDDINVVIPAMTEYRAHKVPFTGEFGRQAATSVEPTSFPLGALALLEKAPILTAAPVSPAEAVAGLLTGCPFVNDDPEEFPALLEVLTTLVASTPVIRLGVAREDSFEAVMGSMGRHFGHG